MSTRVMLDGRTDLTGQQIGSLRVGSMVARRPQPRYNVYCETCGAESTESHNRLQSGAAVCKSSSHGRVAKPRNSELLSEQRQQAAEREAQRQADELEASARRMEAESEDWERPTKYAPENHQLRKALEAEKWEAERPEREALEKTERENAQRENAERERQENLRRYEAGWILTDPDPNLYVTPELATATMPTSKVATYNTAQVEIFSTANPEFTAYKTPSNADKLLAYLGNNGVKIFDVSTLKAAFVRLRDLGILEKRQAPAPQPLPQHQYVNLDFQQEPSAPTVIANRNIGRDQLTGEMREFSDFEIRNMSAETYRRTFAVTETFSELFTIMDSSR